MLSPFLSVPTLQQARGLGRVFSPWRKTSLLITILQSKELWPKKEICFLKLKYFTQTCLGEATTEEVFGTNRSKIAFITVAYISVSGSSGLGCTCLNLVIKGDTRHTLVSFFSGNILFLLLILYCLYSCHPYEIQFSRMGQDGQGNVLL